jgi:hypothetical protein
MPPQNEIDIILKFLVDQASQKNATAAIGGIAGGTQGGSANTSEKVWQGLTEYADKYNLTVQQAAAQIAKMGNAGQVSEQQLLQYYNEYDNILTRRDKVALENAEATRSMQADYAAANAEVEKTAPALNKTAASATKAGKEIKSMFKFSQEGIMAFMAMQVGSELTRISKAMIAPVAEYTKFYGQTTAASARYLQAQKDIEQSTIRVGGTLAQTITPVLELGAKVAGSIADLFEKFPFLATSVASVAGLTFILGTALQTTGQVLMGAMALKGLWASIKMGQAAQSAGATAAAAIGGKTTVVAAGGGLMTTITALLPAVIAAVAAYIALNNIKLPGQKEAILPTAGGTFGKLLTIAASGAGNVFGGPETAAAWGKSVGELTGVIKKADDATKELAQDTLLGQQATDAFIQSQQANNEAEQQLSKERSNIVEEAGKEQAKSEDKYEKARTAIVEDEAKKRTQSESAYNAAMDEILRSGTQGQAEEQASLLASRMQRLRDWALQESRTEEDYYASRTKALADANKQDRRAEEDHQRQMLQMRQEHNQRVGDLLDQQDAFGLLKENKSYELQRKNAEDNYNVEVRRRNEDLAQRLAEMDTQFALERSRRLEDQAQTLADEDANAAARRAKDAQLQQERITQLNADHLSELLQLKADAADKLRQLSDDHNAEVTQMKADTADKLGELEKNYDEEKTRRQNAFNDQLRILDAFGSDETALKAKWYAEENKLLQAYIDQFKGMTPGSNLPGYPIPKEVEPYNYKGPGYKGEQATALWNSLPSKAMTGGASKSISLTQNYTFHGTFTEGDKQWFKDTAKDSAYDAFAEIIQ